MRQALQPLRVLLATFATLACASAGPAIGTGVEPARPPAPVTEERPATPALPLGRANFEYAPGTASYIVASDAVVTEIDSAAARETRTFRETARLDLTIAPADGYVVITTTGAVEGPVSAAIVQPFVDTLRAAGTDTIPEPRLPICGRDTVPPAHLGMLLPLVPQKLHDGLRWERRHVYATCQGAIPIRVERTDSYTVTGRARNVSDGVTIARESSLSFAGSGVEGRHNVRASGSGSARATFVLNATAGRMLSATEESTSEIDVTASGRTRRFSQRVTSSVQLQ